MNADLADRLRTLRLEWPEAAGRYRSADRDDSLDGSTVVSGRPRLRLAAGAVLGGALVAGGYYLAVRAPAPPAAQTAAKGAVATTSMPSRLAASGYLVARRSATVSSQVTGQVERILVLEGQAVAAGQLLAILDGEIAAAGQDRASAAVRAAQAHAGAIGAQLEEAEREVARLEPLHRRGFATAAALSRQQTTVGRLRAELGAAQAEVASAAANVRAAATTRDQHLIRAPFAGIVTAINAQPGEIVSPISAGGGFTRTGICTVVDLESLEAEVHVAEALISRIHVGMPASVTLKAYPNQPYRARVAAILPVADRSRGSFGVRIEIIDRDSKMLPDMAVDVEFQGHQPA